MSINKKNVLFTYPDHRGFPYADDGGMAVHIYGVIAALESEGIRVITFPAKKTASGARKQKKTGRLHYSLIRKTARDLYILTVANTFYFFKLLRFRNKVKVVYNRFERFGWCVYLFCIIFKKELINEINAPFEEGRDFKITSVLNPIDKYVLLMGTAVAGMNITVSESLRRMVIEYGADPKKLISHPNCVSDDFLQEPDGNRISEMKKKYGITEDEIVIGMVAQYRRWHGLEELVRILDAYTGDNKIKLIIIGDPIYIYADQFNNIINSSKTEIIHTGFISHDSIMDHIDIIDICIELGHLNRYGSPLKLIEYGARGKPVIFYKTEPVCEIIKHKENGLLVTDDDRESAVHDVIDSFRDDRQKYKRMGSRLQKLVQSKFTWAHYIKFINDHTDGLFLDQK